MYLHKFKGATMMSSFPKHVFKYIQIFFVVIEKCTHCTHFFKYRL